MATRTIRERQPQAARELREDQQAVRELIVDELHDLLRTCDQFGLLLADELDACLAAAERRLLAEVDPAASDPHRSFLPARDRRAKDRTSSRPAAPVPDGSHRPGGF